MNNNLEIVNVSRETFQEIEWYNMKYLPFYKEYVRQILWWNAKINLVSRNQSEQSIQEHIRHSLVPCITETFWKARTIVDAGTGSGLPGIPLSYLHDDAVFHLVDINMKKVTAVKQMLYNLKPPATDVHCADVATFVPPLKEKLVMVSKHAFKLDELLIKEFPVKYDGFLFLKGNDYQSELNDEIFDKFTVRAYNLQSGTDIPFYKQKYLLEILPKE
jgi:16S rRNA (guanine527-N7)-methyltransferase